MGAGQVQPRGLFRLFKILPFALRRVCFFLAVYKRDMYIKINALALAVHLFLLADFPVE